MANGKMYWAVIVALFALSWADVHKRNVETFFYPDCASYEICKNRINENATTSNTSFPNVVYVRSSAGKDVLHFVMSTVKVPSMLLVHSVGDATQRLSFNWTRLLSNDSAKMEGAVYTNGRYRGRVLYSFALTFTRLFEYDDLNDEASLKAAEKDNNTQWNIHPFSDFVWMNMTQGKGGKSVIFNTTRPQPAPYGNITAGSMYFEFEINSDTGRDSDLPRLKYNANNTQVDFVLDGYVPLYNRSRFALEMSIVANYSKEKMSVEKIKSIDDEFSPGVFEVVNWYTAGKSRNSGYLQYKPVCYLAAERSRSTGTEVMKYPLQRPGAVPGLPGMVGEGLARALFGAGLNDSSRVVQMATNVSFGLSQDGYYLKNNYTAWTASVGYGKPPVEAISTMVIVIIAVGLGLPFIIIIVGGIYVCARKRQRHDGYQDLDSDVSRNNPRLN